MNTKHISTISFCDGDSGSEAIAIIRQCGDMIALTISIRSNGDLSVMIDVSTALELVEALNRGIEQSNLDKGKEESGEESGVNSSF